MTLTLARGIAMDLLDNAHYFTYDMFHSLGESGEVLRFLLVTAEKVPKPERSVFLSQCIRQATDDTMALRILTDFTSAKKSGVDLEVSEPELKPSFIERMRSRYGEHVDAANCDLKTSDQQAFGLWGTFGAEERKIQREFWIRYIGNSRARLAEVFRAFFLPPAMYSSDPEPFIENKVPMSDLRRLFNELPQEEQLAEREQKSLWVLKRLLDGEFKSGVPIEVWDENAGPVEPTTQSA